MMISVGRHYYCRTAVVLLAVAVAVAVEAVFGGVMVSVYGIRARNRTPRHATPR